MVTSLITLTASPKEVEKLIDQLDDSTLAVSETPFEQKKNDYEFKGKLLVDPRKAKPKYRNGALEYGPIEAALVLDYFVVHIDWHKKLGIPHEACIHIKDPCGH